MFENMSDYNSDKRLKYESGDILINVDAKFLADLNEVSDYVEVGEL